MNIKINIVGQTLTAEAGRPELVDGSQNFIKFTFCFDDNLWDDLEVWAVFAQGETNLKRKIVDGTVYLPPEITAGFCYLSLLGTNDTTVATTGKYMLALDKNMVASGTLVSVDGTAGFLLTSEDRANLAALAEALQNGGIGTGAGTDDNAVHYTAEVKTAEQKAQARDNIGAASTDHMHIGYATEKDINAMTQAVNAVLAAVIGGDA